MKSKKTRAVVVSFKRIKEVLFTTMLFIFLSGCGGGGSSSSKPPPAADSPPPVTDNPPPVTGEAGYLIAGAPVAGVTYETLTKSGVTDLEGSFLYEEGETVRFTLGATVLGEFIAKEQITPFDLAGSPVITGQDITWALQDQYRVEWQYYDQRKWARYGEVSSFHAVVNLSVLLQTLDHDANPENGIEIRPGIASLLENVQLDIYQRIDRSRFFSNVSVYVGQDWQTFRNDPTFRHILGLANREHFSEPHRIVKPAVAMDRLYRSLEVDPMIVGLTNLHEENAEGSSTEHFSYDENGYITRHQLGEDYEIWLYDAEGNATQHEQHSDVFNHHVTNVWEYDENGNVTLSEEKFVGNNAGWTPYHIVNYYTYDIDGNLIRFVEADKRDGTESVDRYSYVYDDHGNLEEYVENSDGMSWKYLYTYDSSGDLTHYTKEFPRGTNRWLFDANNNVVLHTEINFGGNEIRRESTYLYSADGKLIRKEVNDADSGSPLTLETWQYDTGNRLMRYEKLACPFAPIECTELDPDIDMVDQTVEVYQYHDKGNVRLREVSTKTFNFEFGVGRDKQQYTYDENGSLIEYESSDWPHGGRWQYDPVSNMTRAEITINDEGKSFVDSIETWDHDFDGNVIKYELDEDPASGSKDVIRTYQYEVTGWGHLFSEINIYGHSGGIPPFQMSTPSPIPSQ